MAKQEEQIFFRFQNQNEMSELFHQIKQFKQIFIERVGQQIQDQYEIQNIWSQFIIRYFQYPSSCSIFRNKIQISADYYLSLHLTQKGFDFQLDTQFLHDIELNNSNINDKFSQLIDKIMFPSKEFIPEMNLIVSKQKFDEEDAQYIFKLDDYEFLQKRFQQRKIVSQESKDKTIQNNNNIDEQMLLKSNPNELENFQDIECQSDKEYESIKNQRIFSTLFWYHYIGIENGQQWQLNKEVFDILKFNLKIDIEIFASPFNNYLTHYFSLFEGDKCFGSLGNFNSNYLNIQQNFQANPPFIDSLFTQFASQILQILDLNTQSEREMGCVIIFPWQDNIGYYQLQNSSYFIDEIGLLSNAHYYYDYYSQTSIKSKFNSNILILGNSLFKTRYLSYPYLADSIVEAFQVKQNHQQ